jgi:peptidoglycan/LPS O-acetylase OafA/YrhL
MQGWYLFCDMQLYLFCPLFILPLHYFKADKAKHAVLLVTLVGFWASPMIVTYVNDLAPTFIFSVACKSHYD